MKPDTIVLVGSPEGIGARVELALSLHQGSLTHPIDIIRCETKKDVIAVCPTGISPLDFPGISMALPTKRELFPCFTDWSLIFLLTLEE